MRGGKYGKPMDEAERPMRLLLRLRRERRQTYREMIKAPEHERDFYVSKLGYIDHRQGVLKRWLRECLADDVKFSEHRRHSYVKSDQSFGLNL